MMGIGVSDSAFFLAAVQSRRDFSGESPCKHLSVAVSAAEGILWGLSSAGLHPLGGSGSLCPGLFFALLNFGALEPLRW